MTAPAWAVEHGDTEAPTTEILRTVVGSEVHGIGIPGTDDHDEMGVYVERPEQVLGIGFAKQHYVARTVPEGHRSRHGDTDLVLYSLRKYLALVATGNPTALLPLFAPTKDVLAVTELGAELRAFGPTLLSQQAGHRFLGYLRSQQQRVLGQDTRHTPNRPELVAAHGFDTKYASHAVRLGMQGVQVVQEGTLTLPMRQEARETVLAIKRGERELPYVLELIESQAAHLELLLDSGRTPLPRRPDLDAANRWLAEAHLAYWSTR